MRSTNVTVLCVLALVAMLACGCPSSYREAADNSAPKADVDSLSAGGRGGDELRRSDGMEDYRAQVFAVTIRAGLRACEILVKQDVPDEEEDAATGCLLDVYSVLAALDSQAYYQMSVRMIALRSRVAPDAQGYCWTSLLREQERSVEGERLLLAKIRVAQEACRKALFGEAAPRDPVMARDILKELTERTDTEGIR
jgi:hypothetical protein